MKHQQIRPLPLDAKEVAQQFDVTESCLASVGTLEDLRLRTLRKKGRFCVPLADNETHQQLSVHRR